MFYQCYSTETFGDDTTQAIGYPGYPVFFEKQGPFLCGSSVIQSLDSPFPEPHEPEHDSSSGSSDIRQAKSRTATQASSKAGYLGELFQIQIANSLLLVFRH
jgi:hypothetical protein